MLRTVPVGPPYTGARRTLHLICVHLRNLRIPLFPFYFQSGVMSEPPSVSRTGVPPWAGIMYSSHGPRSEAPWQYTIDFPSGLNRP